MLLDGHPDAGLVAQHALTEQAWLREVTGAVPTFTETAP
jgi:hypothetical protein